MKHAISFASSPALPIWPRGPAPAPSQQRLNAARAALHAHSARAGLEEWALEIQIADLLIDLRHLVARTATDWQRIESSARHQFLAEQSRPDAESGS